MVADIGLIAMSREGTGYLSGAHNIIPGFGGVRDALQFSVQSVVIHCLSFCSFSFDHYIVCPLIYVFSFTFSILTNINNKYNYEYPNPIYNYT